MGFLPGFEDDVFISYAHNDDDKFGPEKLGWVAQLHEDLAQRIEGYLNQAPRLWRDEWEIAPNEDFAKKIASRLAKTATLLCVVSDSFLNRYWCKRELDDFCHFAEQSIGIQVGEKKRIFKAERRPVSAEALPPQFEGSMMFRFYDDKANNRARVRELRPSVGTEEFRLYLDRMDELAYQIAETLKVMRAELKEPVTSVGTVFLAETTLEQEAARNQVRRDLQDRKITVLPLGELSRRGPQFEQQVREYLKQAELSIHILGNQGGWVPEMSERRHTWLQHDLALERARDPDFRRILWLPSSLDSAEQDQRQFLDYLKTDATVQRGAEILQDRVEDLKTQVLRMLEQIRQPAPSPPPPKSSSEPPSVYIVCDAQDLASPSFLSLNEFLLDRGYEPLKSVVADSAEEARRMHEENLQFCDACLIYYGTASEGWVNTKLSDFLKFRSKRQTPFLSKAVYIAPPVSDAKRTFRTNQAKVIVGGGEFSAAQLSPFLEPLRRP